MELWYTDADVCTTEMISLPTYFPDLIYIEDDYEDFVKEWVKREFTQE